MIDKAKYGVFSEGVSLCQFSNYREAKLLKIVGIKLKKTIGKCCDYILRYEKFIEPPNFQIEL